MPTLDIGLLTFRSEYYLSSNNQVPKSVTFLSAMFAFSCKGVVDMMASQILTWNFTLLSFFSFITRD